MGTGMHFVDVGLGVALVVGILWWIVVLTTRSREQRRQEISTRRIAHQPWDADKTGGRGNR